MSGRFLFLGTGGSMGIPMIGCDCSVCTSPSPHDKRLRPSAFISLGAKNFILDPGPDFRLQALSHNIRRLDGVLITHAHQDHIGGLDELRIFCIRNKKPLPALMSKETFSELKTRFGYIFQKDLPEGQFVTQLDVLALEKERGSIHFEGYRIDYMSFEQAKMKVNGFRMGDLAYLSDIKDYPETIFDDLKGVKHLIISALRFTPSPLHFTVDDAIDFARKVNAPHTWLTHISHELEHEKTNAYLPENVRLAYDGLEISFQEYIE